MLLNLQAGAVALILVTPAFAQDGGAAPAQPAGTPAAATTAPAAMPKVAAGDRWTYDVTDDISGSVKWTRTDMITDVSKGEIAVRVDFDGGARVANISYDGSWDIVRDDPFKYSPNDGTGIRQPLSVGAEWKFAIDVANSRNGLTFRRTGTSKVAGRESITTKAGTFDAFVIETDFTGKNVQDPTLINQTSWRTWYDPDIDHWIKRTIVQRQRGHVVSKTTIELTKYSRAKPQ
jgi:hypothetical protein